MGLFCCIPGFVCCIPSVIIVIFFGLFRFFLRWKSKVYLDSDGKKKLSVAFFHPYCNAGGGGERVLWSAVRSIQKNYPNVQCVIYTGDIDATPEHIVSRARQRFNIVLPEDVEFVFLRCRGWVEAARYPFFTLLGQSLGSILLAVEALFRFVPDVYIDTMGYAFTFPMFKYLGGSRVACYVHYPTISTDMLMKVSQREAAHNNASFISRNPVFSSVKVVYYKLFAFLYGLAGRRANLIMVNSTWTYDHIVSLWHAEDITHILFPPCNIEEFTAAPLTGDGNKPLQIVSLGQFRPEKDHPLQVRAFHKFLSLLEKGEKSKYKLVLAGSCRHAEDEARVRALQDLAQELGVEEQVEFRLNIPFAELKQLLLESVISLHTMWNEHFGIGIVESMAAGAVMLANDSGGPAADIVVEFNKQPTGFLASDVNSYATAMKSIFDMSVAERLKVRKNARESILRFSDAEFEKCLVRYCEPLIEKLCCK